MRPMDMLNDPELAGSAEARAIVHRTAVLLEKQAQERALAELPRNDVRARQWKARKALHEADNILFPYLVEKA
ncbi:hypothetical protein [Zymobacter sp. IVIA_12111.31 C1]|uniref:hypothetical protein n=1 Tax=Zymobacter sp. IVIA_12111.31 C1 TaxID=3394854 RepID=UPI0039C2CABB